jgi:hypothetical protein
MTAFTREKAKQSGEVADGAMTVGSMRVLKNSSDTIENKERLQQLENESYHPFQLKQRNIDKVAII